MWIHIFYRTSFLGSRLCHRLYSIIDFVGFRRSQFATIYPYFPHAKLLLLRIALFDSKSQNVDHFLIHDSTHTVPNCRVYTRQSQETREPIKPPITHCRLWLRPFAITTFVRGIIFTAPWEVQGQSTIR